MNLNLTIAMNYGYSIGSVPHWADGICNPYSSGAEATRRQVRGFFYALTVMVGGALGGRKTCRTQSPVCKPDTSPTALSFATPAGGFKSQALEFVMNNQIAPLAHNTLYYIVTHHGI